MSFRERWINLLYTVATGSRKTRALLTPLGLVVFAVFTTLFVLAGLLVDRLLGLPGLLPAGARIPVSASLVAVGTAITAWSVLHFLRVGGTPVPFNPPPRVVATGPFRYARNPMLTGIFLTLLGIGFGLGSASLVCFFTPLYVLINVWELKKIEEPELAKRFGDEYIEYRNRTPMFFPWTRRARNHMAVFLIATFVWAIFWLAGLPSYYQQYSDLQMIWFDSLVLIPIAAIVYLVLRRLRPERRLSSALWLAFYFTFPLALYDWIYCGLYLGHGVQFLSRYWYLTVYYAIPWILLPLTASVLNSVRTEPIEHSYLEL